MFNWYADYKLGFASLAERCVIISASRKQKPHWKRYSPRLSIMQESFVYLKKIGLFAKRDDFFNNAIDWLINWLTERMIDGLMNCLIDRWDHRAIDSSLRFRSPGVFGEMLASRIQGQRKRSLEHIRSDGEIGLDPLGEPGHPSARLSEVNWCWEAKGAPKETLRRFWHV